MASLTNKYRSPHFILSFLPKSVKYLNVNPKILIYLEKIMKKICAMHHHLRYLLTHVIIILNKPNKLDLSGVAVS